MKLVRDGNVDAVGAVRAAGRALGDVLAGCVNFFNPRVIGAGRRPRRRPRASFAGLREIVFQRSLPLATRNLRVVPTQLGDRVRVIGASIMVIEDMLAPAAIDQALRDAAHRRRA